MLQEKLKGDEMSIKTIKPSLYVKLGRLILTGKTGDKDYTLTWSYKNRYYNVAVTDGENGKNIQGIRVSMNETILKTLVLLMDKVVNSKEEVNYTLVSKSINFDDRESKNLLVKGKLIVGKKKVGDEMINYLALTDSADKIKFTFPLIPSKYYVFAKDGKEINKTSELSDVYLRSYSSIINELILTLPKFTEQDLFDTESTPNDKFKKFNKNNKSFKPADKKKNDFDNEIF